MRVSEFYSLGRSQGSLDFVDVSLETDVAVFISPKALQELDNEWSQECQSSIQNFFGRVLKFIQDSNDQEALKLLSMLREPNETRLGLSYDKPAGRALGDGSARNVWHSLSKSRAAKTGLISDLEDAALFVHGIGRDIISDMTTNIIRRHLIYYTQKMSEYYDIPLVSGIDSGPIWDNKNGAWRSGFVKLPMPGNFGKLLLVPKSIVRINTAYDSSEYYRDYLLEEMQRDELQRGTGLVEILKNGRKRVTKKSLKEKYGQGKDASTDQSLRLPSALERYKEDKDKQKSPPLSHEQIAIAEDGSPPDWDFLLQSVKNIPPGKKHASDYEDAIEALLTALFYPALAFPSKQAKLHEGRKRIDITYNNAGVAGFFKWIALHYPSAKMMVECKNYGGEIGNPELDQLCGRFSPSRGRVGLLICRSLKDKSLMMKRCRDAVGDNRGYVIVLTDEDLKVLVNERKTHAGNLSFNLLRKKFEEIIS